MRRRCNSSKNNRKPAQWPWEGHKSRPGQGHDLMQKSWNKKYMCSFVPLLKWSTTKNGKLQNQSLLVINPIVVDTIYLSSVSFVINPIVINTNFYQPYCYQNHKLSTLLLSTLFVVNIIDFQHHLSSIQLSSTTFVSNLICYQPYNY